MRFPRSAGSPLEREKPPRFRRGFSQTEAFVSYLMTLKRCTESVPFTVMFTM